MTATRSRSSTRVICLRPMVPECDWRAPGSSSPPTQSARCLKPGRNGWLAKSNAHLVSRINISGHPAQFRSMRSSGDSSGPRRPPRNVGSCEILRAIAVKAFATADKDSPLPQNPGAEPPQVWRQLSGRTRARARPASRVTCWIERERANEKARRKCSAGLLIVPLSAGGRNARINRKRKLQTCVRTSRTR
jgi:hypothetical protein